MPIRGIRGAVVADQDTPSSVLQATRELLLAIVDANPQLHSEEIASIFFTVTEDIHSVYPAQAAREIGWVHVPLMCSQEISVPDTLPRVVRVLLHWNTELLQNQIQHVYLGQATILRPDLLPASNHS